MAGFFVFPTIKVTPMKNITITAVLSCLLSPSLGFCMMHNCSQDLSTSHAETCPVCRAEKEIPAKQSIKTPACSLPYGRYGTYVRSPAFLEQLRILSMIFVGQVSVLVPLIYYFQHKAAGGAARRVGPPAILPPFSDAAA